MIDCGNCGHPKRCPEAGRCIMGMMPPADVGPTRKPKERNVNTSTGNVRMKGDKPVEAVIKKVKKKAK